MRLHVAPHMGPLRCGIITSAIKLVSSAARNCTAVAQ
jgi:hypothetical protein